MGSSLPDDSLLASGIKNNSREAFGTLYNRYSKVLYYFSLKYLGDSTEAEELVQTVFVSIWENRRMIDESKCFRNYIYRTAVNTIYNILRKRAVRRKFLISQLQKPEGSLNPYEQIFFNDLDSKLESVIGNLPPQQQKIYNFNRKEGLSHEEIAKRMNISVRTVENHLYRVNRLLKEVFSSQSSS